MIKEEITYPSKSKTCDIHAYIYYPEGEIIGIYQIIHGMQEYIGRYDEFASFLCRHGYLVCGHDHLGHGKSVVDKSYYGYFCKDNPNEVLIEDAHELTRIIKEKHPDVPYYLMGHSMGSFYARQYLCRYGNELSGAIIMGTGFQNKLSLMAGLFLTDLIALFKGDRYRSKFIARMAFAGYNSHFKPLKTEVDYLSRNVENCQRYLKDEMCNFTFTLNGYHTVFTAISNLHKRSLLEKMPKELPVLFVSGSEDPVGEYSKGVMRAIDSFKQVGMINIKYRFYKDDRHEILNEVDRETVYADILNWLRGIC